ncbi:MAG: peptidoglycan-binding protein [Gammaproteobacteria bacterium]|nr:peptidoglycan-binding protein [Gammaproteobacteria bacterium]
MASFTTRIALPLILLSLAGCSATQTRTAQDSGTITQDDYAALKEKEARISRLESELAAARTSGSSMTMAASGGELLPPNAKPGECYARVWVPAKYKTLSKQMLVKEADQKVDIIPAKYEWVEESVMVSEASSRMETIPATYGVEEETIKVSDATRIWRTGLGNNAPPASDDILATAKKYGINLDGATPGMCYHEHYRPAQYETVEQQVLVSEASENVNVTAAQYRTVDKRVLVKEASSQMVEVPASYEWTSEQVLDKPAHTVWQKGKGPIQRIDEATGEIMCLVEVPATYKTIKKRVLKSPATTKSIEIPAEYKTVKVRELVAGPQESKTQIPASYKTVKVSKKLSDASFTWHEVHNKEEPATTRTGAKICLTETPARYKTVSRKVVKTPATSRKVEIPAAYKTIKVRKLVAGPSEQRTEIPAVYKTVQFNELEKDGYMEWRSILCQTNMTGTRITRIQQALKTAGYNPGPIDGSIGAQTMSAVNAFQRDKGLPVDKYLNVKTLQALGVSPR